MKHDIVLKQLDVNDASSILIEYTHANGDKIQAGTPLLSCETAKAITEITSQWDGYVHYCFEEGMEVPLNTRILIVFDTVDEYSSFIQSEKTEEVVAASPPAVIKATRKAEELAQKLGVALAEIPPKALIKEADVRVFAQGKTLKAEPEPQEKVANKPQMASSARKIFKYDNERVVIVGAGKGAEVLIDILLEDYDKTVVLLVDDKVRHFEAFGREYPVSPYKIYEFADAAPRESFDTAIISISANLRSMQFRGRIFDYYVQRDIPFANVISKSADIRRGVQLGQGNIIGANSYIGTKTVIGDNNLISYCAVVGHHNVIGNTNLLAPAMATSGSVKIGSNCIIPAGVNFINGVSVGNDVILPVGYNVSVDIADSSHIKDRR